MAKKHRVGQLEITSSSSNRSGIKTVNMTSATPDQIVGTTFKNVQVNENGEFVVGPNTGGGGATNLTYTQSPTNGTVNSDTGTDATIPLADATNAGLISPSEKTKVGFISITQPVDLDTMEQDVADLTTLSGVTSNAVNLGTFTGTTIPDNQTNKQALQTLETAVETKQQKIQFQDEGVNFGAPGQITTINFTGAGVTGTISGSTLTIDVPSGGGVGGVSVYHSFDYPGGPFSVASPNHGDLFFFGFGGGSGVYWNSSFANWLPIE